MFNFWRGLWAFAFAPLYLGGGGGSSSSNTTTNNYSLQAGIGDNSIGVFGEGNSVSVTNNMSDFGAIEKAFDFGNSTVAGAFDFGKSAIDSNASTYKRFMDSGESLFKTATDAKSADYGRLLDSTSGAFNNLMSFGRDSVKSSLQSMSEAQKNVTALLDTAQSKGTMDNRTMMMLGGGVLLVAALFVFKSKGG